MSDGEGPENRRGGTEARERVRRLESSKVREVANAGFGKPGLLRFWFGESDQPTPAYIRQAAAAALAEGRTFYTHNLGALELRQALDAYLARLHGRAIGAGRLAVTSSGVSALMIAMQAVVDPGDRVVVVTPVWPNLTEIPKILGAEVVRVGLAHHEGRWRLDIGRLLQAITPKTRLAVINSPGNPTGWTMTAEEQKTVLAHCRKLGVWVLSDDVYERLAYDGDRTAAPSFLTIAEPDDRLISANSFSKAWLMTGWRLGWIVAPPALLPGLGTLLEYNTSCAPDFVQAGGLAALTEGEPHVLSLRAELQRRRDRVAGRLARTPGVEASAPDGGMYIFFRLRGQDDSMTLARRLIDEAGLGLAPGVAFGPEGEGWLRWCFANADSALDEGLDRLGLWLGQTSGGRSGRVQDRANAS
ncbi:MAG TPA: pyridoxal phosphate-dependent aminotransferase [Caulobacteraceae bacterium]|jgi:aspartate/methionine/tyrosine aminotransferase|nr:pyridoxal phosphate-dependent aminotransferase [Caulobacteraceae bacterium]